VQKKTDNNMLKKYEKRLDLFVHATDLIYFSPFETQCTATCGTVVPKIMQKHLENVQLPACCQGKSLDSYYYKLNK